MATRATGAEHANDELASAYIYIQIYLLQNMLVYVSRRRFYGHGTCLPAAGIDLSTHSISEAGVWWFRSETITCYWLLHRYVMPLLAHHTSTFDVLYPSAVIAHDRIYNTHVMPCEYIWTFLIWSRKAETWPQDVALTFRLIYIFFFLGAIF